MLSQWLTELEMGLEISEPLSPKLQHLSGAILACKDCSLQGETEHERREERLLSGWAH